MVKNNKQSAIVRLVVLVILMLNQALVTLGYNPLPFSDEQIYEAVSIVYEVVSIVALTIVAIWNWWKNNNMTDVALAGQAEIERIKGARKNAN